MNNKTLKITSNFGNRYELAQARISKNPFYNREDWLNIAKGKDRTDLDLYIAAIENSSNIDVDKFYEDYNYKYADSKTRIAALTNEYMKDKMSSSVHTQERYVYDANGNIVMKDGEPVTEKYEVSDYDYYKTLIKEQNDHNYQMFLRQREQERKDSLGGFGKFAANVGGVALEFASGFTSVIDGVIDSVASIGDAIDGAIAGERLDDAYAKAVADDEDRPFADFQQWVIEFENRYSGLRDLDGNYTNFGKYAGGIATSVGQMLPSILIAKFTPQALGAAGVGASTATKVAGVASQAVFYESIAANNIRDMYNTYTNNGVSISSAQIINNAIIKSAVEISVEKLLGKMLGGSALDNLVFGRTAGKTIGAVGKSTLTKNAMLRILKDAGQEGLEEVLQDTGTFLVDRAYTHITGENFNELEDLSFQSLIDAFVIGAIVSIGGSAVNVLGTSGKAMRSIDKGGKFAAWEYGLNVQSFIENYDVVMKANEKTKSKLTQAALTEMYASYRIVSSIYGEIGYERFKAANDVLTKITEDMEAGKYDVEYIKSAASDVYNTVFGEQTINKQIETEIKEALITSIVDEVERGEELVTLDESINKEIEELYKKDTTLEKVAISKDGTNVVRKDGTIIVPRNLLKNSGADMVIKSSNENDLVKRISDNKYFSLRTDEVLEHYKKLTGNTQASKDEAIRALLFDPDCTLFEAMLITSNKDMYKFLSNLVNLMKNLKVQNASDAMYKNTVKTSVKNMTNVLVQYLKNQQNADYNIDLLTDAQKQNIAKTRWCKDLYSRVVRGDKLSKTDIAVLENRVNGMPVDSSDKEIILNKLKSQDASVRASAMNNIDYAYDKVFTTLYDGDTYLPQTGIPNVAFNNYLQRLGLNLKTLLLESSLTESDIANIQDSYGEITPVTILKFRTEQFSLSVNNAYTFENSDGKYYVVDNSGKRVGYSNYNRKVNSILQGDDVIFKRKKVERTVINAAGDLHNIVRSIVRPGVDKLTANMLSITDVIVDSTLLNDDIKKSIEMSYGRITPETTFMYLREYVLENTGDISIAVNPDGEYIFVNVKPMKSSLKTEKIELTSNETKASEIFKEELLTGMLADLRIVLTDDDIVAEYRPAKIESVNNKPVRVNDNAIYVNRNIAKQGGEYLTFALLHEFQHAIQYENKMNLGMDSQFLKRCSKKVKNAIIADVKKHKPNLFTGNPDDKTIERRVSEFIYHTSGESTAMGMDASPLVDFYPTIVKYTRDGTIITFPWGSSFNLEKGSILLGINIDTSPVSNKLNDVLVKNTKPYTLEQFMANPKTCFVMPNGQLRTFDEGEHYDVIKSVDSDVDRSYWDTLPQVVVEDDFASVKITGSHTNDAIMTTLSIMDTLYDIGMEFTLGEIYYEDANPYSVTVSNDEAENSDDLLQLYSRNKLDASGKMAQEVNTELGSYIPEMSLAKPSKTIKTETETPSKPKAKSRYLSQKEAKGTPLENFYKKGDKTEMSDELKAFVKGSVDVELPYDIADKIKDGTLKTADVMDWFRNTPLDTMDQKMFELINKSYYKNNVIKTPKQLQEHIYDAAYYYATRAIVRASGNQELLFVDDDKITKAQTEAFRNISDSATMTDGRGRKVKVKNVFSRIVNNYYYKGKNQDEPIDISEKYAKTLWMHFYDGSLQTAGRIASISKWTAIRGLAVAGELKTLSLDAKVDGTDDESDTLLELTEDKAALQEMVELVTNSDVSKKEKLVRNRLLKGMITLIQKKYGTTDEAAVKAKLTWRKITQMSADELNSASIKALLSELLDVDYEKVMNSTSVENAVSKVERTPWSIVNNTNYHVNKIRKYLPKAQLKLFLKENSDLFTEDLKLRPEVTKKLDAKGRLVYRDTSELLPVFEKVKEIAEDVKMGAYKNRTSLNQFVKAKRTMLAIQEDYVKRLKEPVKKAKDVKTITIEVADDVLNIDTTKSMPKALERILDFEFTKAVKSRTQYVTNDDDYHFQTNLKTFLDTNAEYLEALTQQDVDDIIDYYTNSEILKVNISESKYRLYNAVQLYMSVYLLRGNKLGVFTLTDEQYKALEKRTEVTVSVAAQQLSDWKAAMKMIKPEETIINSLAKSAGVQFNPSDLDDLTQALYSGDVERIQSAKQKMYLNAKKNYEGRKHTFWDKLFQFERMAMLSGPGTWIRNIVSNATIGGIYYKGEQKVGGLLDMSEKVGDSTWKVINKIFPKTDKWKREKQFQITGTKVTSEVKDFIDNNIIKTGLLTTITDGLSKYDVRKSKGRTGAENLTDMIARSVATKIFYANTSDIKALDTAYNFVFKMLSDDKYVTRNMIKYLGKMLTEDNVELDQGINSKITDYIAEAYTLAAQDYMHKPNVWNKIDAAIRTRTGPVAYFAYKQFFPFAATSWNWFMEGLNYSPVGLVKSIVQFAKLENTIDKLDEARRKGDTVISSRFAEYTIRRNIGKGVIGTIGLIIGTLLAAFGVAKLDEEDDKYKLTIGDVTVDISDVFGTQGIFMGMAITGSLIKTVKDEEYDFMDVFVTALDTMLTDSAIADIWTTIRYNETAGEWIAALPMQTLNNCVPNFLKTVSNVVGIYDAKFDAGVLGKIEKLAVNAIPGLVYAMPKQVDIYTGEYQIMYKAQFITELVNKLTPFDISPLNLSEYERAALDLDIHKTMLSGKYSIGDKELVLKAGDVQKLNQYYGELNKKDLEALLNNQLRLKVKNENGTYSKLLYSKMTEKQKKAAFTQIMGKNSQYAQVYILTSKGYKYYASESEYMELRKLGVTKNVYRKTNKLSGFVEP